MDKRTWEEHRTKQHAAHDNAQPDAKNVICPDEEESRDEEQVKYLHEVPTYEMTSNRTTQNTHAHSMRRSKKGHCALVTTSKTTKKRTEEKSNREADETN